ncbi:MAG: ABC transporter ATP-binding protein [Firmicutes bacterium]|nr:ABC transporter ATP-binding protein [Bacillota bacterium]
MGRSATDLEALFAEGFQQRQPFRTLFRLYQGFGWRLFLSVVFFVIKHSPVWVLPIVTANIIDIVGHPAVHRLHEIWPNLIVILLMILQNLWTHTLHVRYLSEAVRGMETRLRGALIRRLQQLSISFHHEARSGQLQAKVLRDVEAVQNLSRQLFSSMVAGLFSILVAVGVTAARNWRVILFYLVTVPISTLLVTTFRRGMGQKNREFRQEVEQMAARISESIQMIPVTRAHGLEEKEIARIEAHLARVQDKGLRLDIFNAVFGAAAWVTFQIFQVLCLVFTGFLAYYGRISVGDIVLYQGFFNTIVMAVANIVNIYPELSRGFESIHSIGEILCCTDLEENQGKRQVREVRGDFLFQDVTYVYPGTSAPAIRHFNLEVKAGECIAVLGESGAGKTTLLNLIVGFLRPTGGRILLDGVDMNELDLRTYRRFLAVVPQETILFSGTIRENILYGLSDVDEDRLWHALTLANAREFVEKLPQGLDTPVGEHGGKLSGGQRQRIAIARALIRDPRIIVLDEATSALDSVAESQVIKGLRALIEGRTTFIVAHRLASIRLAHRVVVMRQGTPVEIGTPAELAACRGEFHRLQSMEA